MSLAFAETVVSDTYGELYIGAFHGSRQPQRAVDSVFHDPRPTGDRMPHEFKRFQMQVDLRKVDLSVPALPSGYQWIRWRPILSDRHAMVKWRSFRDDLDGRVFRCLSQLEGCRRLIDEIGRQPKFSPAATWLISYQPDRSWPAVDCATIQGIARSGGIGSIQNVGVVPDHRGNGLGRAIVVRALQGFWMDGLTHASLEVTAENEAAVTLYRSLGFQVRHVLYREASGGKVVKGSERLPDYSDLIPSEAGT